MTGMHGADDRELDLDQLAREVAALAKQHDLIVVPALPEANRSSPQVSLTEANATATWFVQTAVAAGARLLYAHRRTFTADDTGELAAALDDEDRTEDAAAATAGLLALSAATRRYEGRTCELGLAFVAGGVLHRWAAQAAWHSSVADALDQLRPGTTRSRERPANAGQAWSPDQQARLEARFREGASVGDLASEFGRTRSSIQARLRRAGLVD
jgi:hypothetical protein